MNSISVIHPYWFNGSLVFDDEDVGLRREPFVSGADVVLSLLASRIDGCSSGFTLRFSDQPFPGYQTTLEWLRPEYGGNWYSCSIDGVDHEGWLCPALLKYFEHPPGRIYLEIAASRRRISEMWPLSRGSGDPYS